MKKIITFFTLLFYYSFSLMLTVSALVPKSSSFYVADYANVISISTEQTIIATNAKLEKLTRGQIVVVTVESLSGLKSSEYASKLMNEWGVGDAQKNNGMLLLLAPKDKKGWLIQGSGIANVFTSSKVNDMLDKYFWPDVDKGRYDSAVNSIFRQMINWYEGYYKVSIPISYTADSKPVETNPYYGGYSAGSSNAGASYGSSSSSTYGSSGNIQNSIAVSGYNNNSSGNGAAFAILLIFIFFLGIVIAILSSSSRKGNRSGNTGYYARPRRRGSDFGNGFVGGYMVGRSIGERREDEDRDNGGGFGSGFGGQSSGGGGGRDDEDSSSGFGSGFGGHSSDGGGGRDDDSGGGFGGFSSGGGGGSFDSGSSFSGGSSSDCGGGFSGGGGGGRD